MNTEEKDVILQNIKDKLVGLAVNDKLPTDMTQLDMTQFEECFINTQDVLSQRTEELITEGLKTCGLDETLEAYDYIVERLYVHEVDEVKEFFNWLFQTGRPFGRVNSQQRWKEFKAAQRLNG